MVNDAGDPHGFGTWEVFEEEFRGSLYIGGFSNGFREGLGMFTSNDGDVYQGEWVADDFEGFGKVFLPCCFLLISTRNLGLMGILTRDSSRRTTVTVLEKLETLLFIDHNVF